MKQLVRIAVVAALVLLAGLAGGRPATISAQAPALGGCPIFAGDNIWNTPVDTLPLESRSSAYVNSIGTDVSMHPDFGSGTYNGGPIGIPFVVVPAGTTKTSVTFQYASESDAGPYPIPSNPPIEYGSDHHILMVEPAECKLYELYAAQKQSNGSWRAGSGAIFDLRSNALRPDTWTSADAAGLPILPGLVRYDDVAAGAIDHALRFTADNTRKAHVWPARHDASDLTNSNIPPMGQRFRLKASFDIHGFSHDTQVILTALKKYGMFLADNGSNWYLNGAPDARWDNNALVSELRQVHGSDFEAVDMSSLQVSPNSAQVKSAAQDRKSVAPGGARQGQTVVYTIQIAGDGATTTLSDPLPAGASLAGGPTTSPASVPPAVNNGGTIAWSGTPPSGTVVTISYSATVDTATIGSIANTATIARGSAQKQLTAILIANPRQGFLPITRR